MNTMMKTWSGLIAAGALMAWSTPGITAARSVCLSDATGKLCVVVTPQPDESEGVQASKLDGPDGTDTYVRYVAKLSRVELATASRYFNVSFALSPAVEFTFTSSAGVCAQSGATLNCTFDKTKAPADITVDLTATAPEYDHDQSDGDQTASALTNTVTIAWNGRSSSMVLSHEVTTEGGYTHVPPGDGEIVLKTGPSDQVTTENPLYAEMHVPQRPEGFKAFLGIVTQLDSEQATDFSTACTGGLWLPTNSDGGPYVCRDIGAPNDAGDPTRWVAAYVDPSVDGTFQNPPIRIKFNWDTTIVPDTQLAGVPNGTPPVAIFYKAHEEPGEQHPYRAFGRPCVLTTNALLPCVSDAREISDGDWTATLSTSFIDNGGAPADIDPLRLVLEGAVEWLDLFLNTAHSGVIPDFGVLR